MNYKSLIAVIVHIFLFASLSAHTQIVSTFDANDEGWRVVDICALSFTPPDLTAGVPSYSPTNGNMGGYVWQVDRLIGADCRTNGANWYFFVAPAKYLGNRSNYYGGSLSFDIRRHQGGFDAFADVILEGAGIRLVRDAGSGSTRDVWTSYIVPLSASTNWHIGSTGGAMATEIEFQTVLANLTALRIRGERTGGADSCDLDNVVFSPTMICCPHSNIHASEVQVCWDSYSGARYQVQFRSALTTNAWVNLGNPVAGSGTTYCVSDAIASPQRFYQVIVVP